MRVIKRDRPEHQREEQADENGKEAGKAGRPGNERNLCHLGYRRGDMNPQGNANDAPIPDTKPSV